MSQCGSCGAALKRYEVGLCALCRAVISSTPEHIRSILPRVWATIVEQKAA